MEYLTITDIARRLGEGESTVRSWRNVFKPLIPERIGDDGRRTYPVEIFETIRQLREVRPKLSNNEIRQRLGQAYPLDIGAADVVSAGAIEPSAPSPAAHDAETLTALVALSVAQSRAEDRQALADLQAELARQTALLQRLADASDRAALPPPKDEPPRWSLRWWLWRILG